MPTVIYRNGNESDAAKDRVPKLIFQLGRQHNLNMDYGLSTIGTYSDNVPRIFVNFGYSKGGSYRPTTPKLCTRPFICRGQRYEEDHPTQVLSIDIRKEVSYHEKHTWVIEERIHWERKLYTPAGKYVKTEQRKVVHCDFGCGSNDDSYYYDVAFNTK